MPEFIRDPSWEFIGVIVAVVVTVFVYLKQRQRKALSYEIISTTPLVSVREEVKGRLKILLDDNPVEDVYLVMVKIINSGNVPIRGPDDYERHVSLGFGDKAKILTAEVSKVNPKNLQPEILIDGGKGRVRISAILLNSKDSITLKMLVSRFNREQFNVDGRIVGVKEIRELSGERSRFYIKMFIFILILSSIVFGWSLWYTQTHSAWIRISGLKQPLENPTYTAARWLMVLGFLAFAAGIVALYYIFTDLLARKRAGKT